MSVIPPSSIYTEIQNEMEHLDDFHKVGRELCENNFKEMPGYKKWTFYALGTVMSVGFLVAAASCVTTVISPLLKRNFIPFRYGFIAFIVMVTALKICNLIYHQDKPYGDANAAVKFIFKCPVHQTYMIDDKATYVDDFRKATRNLLDFVTNKNWVDSKNEKHGCLNKEFLEKRLNSIAVGVFLVQMYDKVMRCKKDLAKEYCKKITKLLPSSGLTEPVQTGLTEPVQKRIQCLVNMVEECRFDPNLFGWLLPPSENPPTLEFLDEIGRANELRLERAKKKLEDERRDLALTQAEEELHLDFPQGTVAANKTNEELLAVLDRSLAALNEGNPTVKT